MATKSEIERLAVVEEKVDRQGEDIKDIKDDVKTVLSRIDNLENVFVTRREVALIKFVIGVGFSLVGAYLAYVGIK